MSQQINLDMLYDLDNLYTLYEPADEPGHAIYDAANEPAHATGRVHAIHTRWEPADDPEHAI